MKSIVKLFFILLIILVSKGLSAQIYPNPNGYAQSFNRTRTDSAILLPTICGTPNSAAFTKSTLQNRAQLLFDSCGHKWYGWDPSLKVWAQVNSSSSLQSVTDAGDTTSHSITTRGLSFAPFYDLDTESPSVFFQSLSSDYFKTYTRISTLADQTEKVEESGDNCSSYSTGVGQRWRWTYKGTGTPKSPFIIDYDSVHVDGVLSIKNGGLSFPDGTYQTTAATGGGGGLSGGNLGSGYRPYYPPSQGVKTFFGSFGLGFDSTTNSNGLTITIDSSKWATSFSNSQKYTLDSTSRFGGLKSIFRATQDSLALVASIAARKLNNDSANTTSGYTTLYQNSLNVHTTGNQFIWGIKTFTTSVLSDQFASIADTSISIVPYSIGAAKIQNVYFSNGLLQVAGTSFGAMNSGLLSFTGGAFHIGSYGTTYDIDIDAPNTRVSNNLYIASLNGLLKSASGLVSTATSGTDYQAPITLTTTGTGAATFVSNVLNIPTPTFANPSASVGLSANNGSATTFMRSDATPALSQSINPTWSGNHTFTNAPIFSSTSSNGVAYIDASKKIVTDATNLYYTTGQLAIGTNSVGVVALTVAKSTVSDGIATLQNTSTGGYSTLSLLDNSGTKKFEIGYGNSAVSYTPLQNRGYFNAAADFAMLMNGVEAMTLAVSTANVGIRTLVPTAYLHIKGGTATAGTAPEKYTAGTLLTTTESLAKEANARGFYSTNVGLNRYAEGGKIFGTSADVSNSSTTETDLVTYTTKASTLGATDESLVMDIAGTLNDITATAQIQFYFAGNLIGNTGALTVSATGGWSARVVIIRSGSTTAKAMVTVTTPGASTAAYTSVSSLTGITFTNTNIIKCTGTAGSAGGGTGDITASAAQLIWWGSTNN